MPQATPSNITPLPVVDKNRLVRGDDVYRAISGIEGDLHEVLPLATLMFDVLSRRGPIDDVHKAALTHLAADLVEAGERLKEAIGPLYESAGIVDPLGSAAR